MNIIRIDRNKQWFKNRFFSTEQTATLLAELAAIETKKGTTITAPTSLGKEREQVQMSLLQLPTFFAIV